MLAVLHLIELVALCILKDFRSFSVKNYVEKFGNTL